MEFGNLHKTLAKDRPRVQKHSASGLRHIGNAFKAHTFKANAAKCVMALFFIFTSLAASANRTSNKDVLFQANDVGYRILSDVDPIVEILGGSRQNFIGEYEVPAQVTYNEKTYKVVAIGPYAFAECFNLTSIIIPEGVTTIGADAFLNCTNLASVTLPNSLTTIEDGAFIGCIALTSLNIPDNVTTIKCPNFVDCAIENLIISENNTHLSLTDGILYDFDKHTVIRGIKCAEHVTIPEGFTTIGNGAFSDCNNITSVTLPNSITTIEDCAFENCPALKSLNIPDNVTTIDVSSFFGDDIENLVISENNTHLSLSDGVLYNLDTHTVISDINCTGHVTIPEGVTTIGYSAFLGSDITSITLPNSLVTIDGYAFHGSELNTINIPDGVSTIGDNAFSYCEALKSITLPANLKKIRYEAFADCINLTTITIPDGVTTIEEDAFHYCSNLTSIELPNSIDSIECNAFSDCSSLTSIEFPKNITLIEDGVLSGCTSLNSITIPSGVTEFQMDLNDCTALKSICCFAATPPTCWWSYFENPSNITMYVPTQYVEIYKDPESIPWCECNIVGFDAVGIKDVDVEEVRIVTDGGAARFVGAENLAVSVYDLGGTLVFSTDSYRGETVSLAKGIYIVKIANKAHKIRI